MTQIKRGELLRISEALGCEVRVREGRVWITQYGDTADYVVEAGASFRINRPGLALVSALKPSTIDLGLPAMRLAYAA